MVVGVHLGEGLVAAIVFGAVGNIDPLSGIAPLPRAVLVGIGYLTVIRAKVATFDVQGKDVPFGLEFFYEQAKGFVYKRINRIAKAARYEETTKLATEVSLVELGTRAKLNVEQDGLLSLEDKRVAKTWIVKVLGDANTSDFDKRAALANYILSGERSSDFA